MACKTLSFYSLPITSKDAENSACPRGLKALQEYVPECLELALGMINMLILEETVFIMSFDDEVRGRSSLYHCSVIGSSPDMMVQGT